MKKRLLLLINPVAGKSEFRTILSDICEEFYSAGFVSELHYTMAPGDASRIAAESAAGFDLLTCIGGDGTLSEFIAGLIGLPNPPPIGYIPFGTTNDVAKSLGISRDPLKAARAIVEGKPSPLDVGVFGDNGFFTYIAAFGAFTNVSYTTPLESKQTFGHLAYLFEGMMSLPKITHYHTRVEYDDGELESDLIFGAVTNTLSVGGLVRLDDSVVSLSDGLFEIILVKNPRNLSDMNSILGSLMSRNYTGPDVTILHSSQARFSFDEPVAWTRDGENGGEFGEIVLRNLHEAVRIVL